MDKRFGIIVGDSLSACLVMAKLSVATFEKLSLVSVVRAQYWQLTTDPETLPKNATWYVMTHIPNLKYHQVGNLYGLRNWVEYGLKQSKNELGWADFRVTSYAQIERWWEMVMSAYLLVSLHTNLLHQPQPQPANQRDAQPQAIVLKLAQHPSWNPATGWKQVLRGYA